LGLQPATPGSRGFSRLRSLTGLRPLKELIPNPEPPSNKKGAALSCCTPNQLHHINPKPLKQNFDSRIKENTDKIMNKNHPCSFLSVSQSPPFRQLEIRKESSLRLTNYAPYSKSLLLITVLLVQAGYGFETVTYPNRILIHQYVLDIYFLGHTPRFKLVTVLKP
jgi:hypothetical protein